MPAHTEKLKLLTLDIGGSNFEIQCRKAEQQNNTPDGTPFFTFAPDGGGVDDADPAYALDLEFYSDWRLAGITDWLWDHDGETVPYQLDLNYDIPGSWVRFNGELKIKAPNAGGTARDTAITAVTLVCIDKPVKTRP